MKRCQLKRARTIYWSNASYWGYRKRVSDLMVVVVSGSVLEPWPWGNKFIFDAFKRMWASNPGAMAYFCTCWKEHSALSSHMQLLMLSIAQGVFNHLDWGELRVKQTFAAEVMRLETESRRQTVQMAVSELLRDFPEIRQLWLQSIYHLDLVREMKKCPSKWRSRPCSMSGQRKVDIAREARINRQLLTMIQFAFRYPIFCCRLIWVSAELDAPAVN